MNLQNTTELFYKLCAERVKNKIKESKLTLKEIYPIDPKLISRIQNNRRYDGNPYLLTDTVIMPISSDSKSDSNIGLVPLLFKTEKELLWGTDEEISRNLYSIFEKIILDLLNDSSEIEVDINYILCDYVPYAENYAYWHLLKQPDIKSSPILNAIDSKYIKNNKDRLLSEAIRYLYLKCDVDFHYLFNDFTENIYSYKKINCVLYKQFIKPQFIPMLRKYTPTLSSLGIRAREIIISDLSSLSNLITKEKSLSKSHKKYFNTLLDTTYDYVSKLADIQKEHITLLKL